VFSVAGIGFATNSKGAFLFYPSGLSTLIDTVFISAMLQLPRLNYLASDEWEGALGGSRVSSEADQTTCAKDRRIAELEWQLQEAEKENRALRRERTYNRGLIEASLDGLITVDSDLIITDVNEQMCHMVARTRDQLIGTPFASYFAEPERAAAGMLYALEQGAINYFELDLPDEAGRNRLVSLNAAVFRDETDAVRGVIASARDITWRKEFIDALEARRQRLDGILELLPTYLVLITEDYRLNYVNRTFRQLIGDAQGHCCCQYLYGRDKPCVVCGATEVMKSGCPYEWEWTSPQGQTYHVFNYPFVDIDGSHLILEMGIDITERKAAEEEIQTLNRELEARVAQRTAQLARANQELHHSEASLRETLREKEILLNEIHHRVKNNLQIVYSMLNLQALHTDDAPAREVLNESKNRVFTMAMIHEQLFQSESLAEINLREYIERLVANLFTSYGTSEFAIRSVLHVEEAALDINHIIPCALIINELISNALKHAFPRGRLADGEKEISLELRRDPIDTYQHVLRVSDNGIGLPPGFDVSASRSLGMHLVDILVRQLRGSLHAETGSGTVFTVRF
jgi:PAS domain S-box-containing protein